MKSPQRGGFQSTMTVMLASGGDTIRLIRNRDPSALTSYSYAAKLPRSGMCDQPDLEERCRCPNRRWRSRRERGGHQAGVRRQEVQLAAVGSPARIAAALDRDRIALSGFREAASLRSRIGRSGRRRRRSSVRRGRPALRMSVRHLAGRAPVDRWPASSRSPLGATGRAASIHTNRPSRVQPMGFARFVACRSVSTSPVATDVVTRSKVPIPRP